MRNLAHLKLQRGVGLIEILVTLFILAIGLLGVASLQFVGSFANKDAISRTQSELVANQVAERLRAAASPPLTGDGMVVHNQYFASANYNFTGLSCSGDPYDCHCLSRPAGIPDCEGNQCSALEVAQYDGWALSCAAVQTNPTIQLSVTCTDLIAGDANSCSAGSMVHILVSWPVHTAGNQQYSLHSRCNPNTGDKNSCIFKDILL